MSRFQKLTLFIMALGCWPVAAMAQQLGQGQDVGISIWRVLGSLFFCLLLSAAAIFLIKRKYPSLNFGALQGKNTQSRIHLIDQLSLSPQRAIYLVEIDGRNYAVAFSASSAHILPVEAKPEPAMSEDDAV
ncbi:MAG: hypothetical protein HC843_11010 [Sphingomonadales bacterium]|nr:hypothetical protein [Sphingomonadales bacterium]